MQRNAIQSWMALDAPLDILLLNNDEGTAEIAAEFDLRHEPNIPQNVYGLPFAGSLFARAQELAHFDLMMYINSDIILTSDFVSTVRSITEQLRDRRRPFLIVGQRHSLQLKEPLDFSTPNWENLLKKRLKQHGGIDKIHAIDYFIFQKIPWWDKIPKFRIGLSGFDNWILYKALSMGMDTASVHSKHLPSRIFLPQGRSCIIPAVRHSFQNFEGAFSLPEKDTKKTRKDTFLFYREKNG